MKTKRSSGRTTRCIDYIIQHLFKQKNITIKTSSGIYLIDLEKRRLLNKSIKSIGIEGFYKKTNLFIDHAALIKPNEQEILIIRLKRRLEQEHGYIFVIFEYNTYINIRLNE